MFFKHNNDITNKFLYYFFIFNSIKKYAKGSIGIGSLNKKSLYNIEIPNLSLSEQNTIVEYLDNLFKDDINKLNKLSKLGLNIFFLIINKEYEYLSDFINNKLDLLNDDLVKIFKSKITIINNLLINKNYDVIENIFDLFIRKYESNNEIKRIK